MDPPGIVWETGMALGGKCPAWNFDAGGSPNPWPPLFLTPAMEFILEL